MPGIPSAPLEDFANDSPIRLQPILSASISTIPYFVDRVFFFFADKVVVIKSVLCSGTGRKVATG